MLSTFVHSLSVEEDPLLSCPLQAFLGKSWTADDVALSVGLAFCAGGAAAGRDSEAALAKCGVQGFGLGWQSSSRGQS